MITVDVLREFLGWCTLINLIGLALAVLAIRLAPAFALNIHRDLFGLDDAVLRQQYFQYLAIYKIAFLVFNLTPYLALVLMG